MAEEPVRRRLAAILAADVVGYSRLMGADEVATRAQFNAHLSERIQPRIAAHHGRIVKAMGDGLLVEFASVVEAVRCAMEVQAAVAAGNADTPEDRRMTFRIGVNLGDVIIEGDDIHGDGVNVAARLEALAEPGGVVVSGTVHEHVQAKVDFDLDDLGPQQIKNIAAPVRAFRVRPQGTMVATVADADASPPPADTSSIAVLPFNNISGDPEQEYFADGISEDLITDLTKISGLFVVARNSSFAFKAKSPDVREVGRRLGVRHVLEGSVRRAGNKVWINAQLIDAATGGHLWAERYDGDLEDIFALQDDITAKIVLALEVHLTPADRESTRRKPIRNAEAYDLYLKGRSEYYLYTPGHLAKAKKYFEEAIAIDPTYAEAYAHLSYCHTAAYVFAWPGADEDLDRAVALAEQAVALDDKSAVAHARLGWIQGYLGQFDRAVANFEKAVRLNPRNAEAFYAFGETMNRGGDPARALPLLEKAFGIDMIVPPGSYFAKGHALLLLRRYDEAVGLFLLVIDRVSRFVPARVQLARAYGEMDRIAEAKIAVSAVLEIAPRYTMRNANRMFPYPDAENRRRLLDGLRKAGLPE